MAGIIGIGIIGIIVVIDAIGIRIIAVYWIATCIIYIRGHGGVNIVCRELASN